jgi:hypothetical protein
METRGRAFREARKVGVTFGLGHRLIMPQPDADGRELDEGEVVGGALFVSGGDRTVVFDLIEEAFDEVPVAIEEGAEHWWGEPA